MQFQEVKKEKNQINKVFKTRAEFVLAGMKARWDEWGGRIVMGDNTDGYRGSAAADQVPLRWNLGSWV